MGLSAKEKKQKKDYAFQLFMNSEYTQGEMAKMVGVTESTFSKWVNENDKQWIIMRSANTVTRTEQRNNLLFQLKELDDKIKQREPGSRYATSAESDSIRKITAAIKDLDQGISITDYINVFKEFSNYLRLIDQKLAVSVSNHMTEFLHRQNPS